MKVYLIAFAALFVGYKVQSQNLFPSTGAVGIGTSAPSSLLHVNAGNIKLTNPTGYPWGINLDINYTTGWNREFSISYNGSGKLLSFGASGVGSALTYGYIGGNTSADASNILPWMAFKPNGNVGIGTVAPIAKLTVETTDSTLDNMVRLENKAIPNSLLYIGTANNAFPVTDYRKENVIESYSDLHISAANAGSNLYFETGRLSASATIRMTINNLGNVGIGTTSPGSYKLAVEGTIGARKVKVQQAAWADYVFGESYHLSSLPETEQFIKKNKHLPDIPSASEVEKEGLDLGEMNKLLLQKIEELTLHVIELNKRIMSLETNQIVK